MGADQVWVLIVDSADERAAPVGKQATLDLRSPFAFSNSWGRVRGSTFGTRPVSRFPTVAAKQCERTTTSPVVRPPVVCDNSPFTNRTTAAPTEPRVTRTNPSTPIETLLDRDVQTHVLDNGLVLVLEPMAAVQSVALSLLLPAGSAYEPPGRNGTAAILCDLVTRGAGDRDSRELTTALDNLGVQRAENVSSHHVSFSAATISHQLEETLRLYADILLRPRLPEEEFEPAQLGVAAALQSLEDEPRQKVFVELRRRVYDSPWGHSPDGRLEELESVTLDDVRAQYELGFRPNGAILGIAGRFDPHLVRSLVETLLGPWDGKAVPTVETAPFGEPIEHITLDSTQTQIGVAFPSVPYRDPAYYAAYAAVNVLSGGSSSRMWTEIREKRGLCYSVYATLSSLRDRGAVFCYAGTTTERAQQTLDLVFTELARMGEGITAEELDRCKVRAKTSLVMQQESSMSRAGSIARDWFHLGRVQPLHEVQERIDALTPDDVMQFVAEHPPADFTVLTMGEEPLEVKGV
jgi:predicted Zn-dependent peptidase